MQPISKPTAEKFIRFYMRRWNAWVRGGTFKMGIVMRQKRLELQIGQRKAKELIKRARRRMDLA